MIDHGSRSTRGPGPSRCGLWAQKHDLPPLKQDCCLGGLGGQDPTKLTIGKAQYNFCFMKFSPSGTVEAVDALQTLFRAP